MAQTSQATKAGSQDDPSDASSTARTTGAGATRLGSGRRQVRLWHLAGLCGLLTVAALAGSLLGVTHLPLAEIFNPESTGYQIFWNLRVPRVCVAFLAGAGLASCGMVFQALFLNSLATPYTLGVSSGAACGAAFAIYLGGMSGLATGFGVMSGALLGATTSVILILVFSQTRMGHQRHVMLLAGVAVSFFFSSLLMLIQSLASFYQSFQIIRWLLGGISVAGYREVGYLAPVVLSGCALIFLYRRHLNLLLLGDDLAHARGLAVPTTKRGLVVLVSIMVAVIVSVTGPIGFVGLVTPHVARLVWGSDHRDLIPVTFLGGGILLVICDLIARLILAPSGLPVGVVTSLIGAPFFFTLLMRRPYRF
ncbi:Iron ABC transporter permease [Sulfidibacter corallicola]|uniref:Iron ABC transporter permease n=1 Tax=Sulfidibacter corallicola TaxID=2818388 RepID=A0A8A4TLZ5_SULCO|nr:iron ABC transporter permease [Sulfidibacter corallicola]QTD47625.1 iron ABC transporter permease [Sulfidibacter corallicola]